MTYEWAGKLQGDSHKMACWGINFVPPDGTSCLLGQIFNIDDTRKVLFQLLYSQAPPYKEALNWIQFAYTGDRTEAYLVPTSTELV